MSLHRAGKRTGIGLKAIYAFLVALLFIVQATPSALAGTTGILSGTVTAAQSAAPLANVKVTAVAPTGRYSATTNSSGFYSIAGVFSDTYTVSFELQGYEPQSRPGVTVFADQTENLNVAMAQSLKTIAKVAARSPGSAYQPNQTTDTYNITSNQINTINGTALNLSESNLITSLPGGSFDSSGYPVIRGGRENEENFQFEGIPYTDAFTNQFTNSLAAPGLGLQAAQLTPGLGDASSENYGTGSFNLVAKRGTYPGFATAQLAVGGPAFRHAVNLEYGWATADGRLSNYMTLAASDQARNYGDGLGVDANSIGTFFSRKYQSSREFVDNLIYKFGRNNNMAGQFFIDMADFHFYNGNGGSDQFCFRSCDPLFIPTALSLNGLANTPANKALIQGLMPLDPYQTNANETFAQTNGRKLSTNYQPNIAYKFGYTWNINPTTFLQAMAYHTNAVTTFDLPLSGGYSTTGSSRIQLQGGTTTGEKLDITKQMGDRHLMKIGASVRYLHPVFDSPVYNYSVFLTTPAFAGAPSRMIADWFNPAQCLATYGPAYKTAVPNCSYLYNQGANSIPAGTLIPQAYENTKIGRNDYAAYIQDTWTPSDKLKINYGVRLDVANYQYPPAVIDPFTCTSEYYPNYTRDSSGNIVFTPSTNPNAQTYDPNTGAKIGPQGSCPVATFALTDAAKQARVPQPDISVSYRLGANDSLRSSYGRSVEFPPLALVDNSANPGYYGSYSNIPADRGNPNDGTQGCGPRFDQQCVNFGQQLRWQDQSLWAGNPPLQPVRPVVFTNVDFSWSHQFTRGMFNGVGFKVTPYYRKAHDETATVSTPLMYNGVIQTDPITGAVLLNPPTANNAGVNQDTGVEMQITKESLYGFSGQLSMTYQNEFSSVIPVSSSEDFFPSIPAPSVALGNVYRVGFLSPFVASFDLAYRTRNGWRINPQIQYNVGYPNSPGTLGVTTIRGLPYNIPNTNAISSNSPFGAPQYVDPMNPGSFFKPNINATRGIEMRSSPGAVLSHPSSVTNLNVEYVANPKVTFGFQLFNVFKALYGGAGFNGRYQAVANGISGPLTGQTATAFNPLVGPTYGVANYGLNRNGNQPYIDTPNGSQTFFFYTTFKL